MARDLYSDMPMNFTYKFKSQSSYSFKKYVGGGASSDVLLYTRKTKGLPDQDVVLKILKEFDESTVQELVTDGNCLSVLNHPNILTTFGFERLSRRKLALLLEYFPSSRLGDVLPRFHESHRELLASYLITHILTALMTAHKSGIVHGDISDRNILVSDTGQVKLADFGLATIKTGGRSVQDDCTKASIDYLAPERWRGGPSTEQSDIYAVGVLAYEILSGEKYFKQITLKSGRQCVEKFLDDRPWSHYPRWSHFFAGALSKDPHLRPSIADLLTHLPASKDNSCAQSLLAQYVGDFSQSGGEQAVSMLKTACLSTLFFAQEISPRFRRMAAALIVICAVSVFGKAVPCEEAAVGKTGSVLLTLTSRPWGSVFIDGKFLGYTPLVRLKLDPGYHEILWKSPKGVEIMRSLQAYKTRHLHYKILLEKPRKSLSIAGTSYYQ